MIIYGSITELLFNNIGDIGEIIVSIFVQFQIILIFSTYFRDSIVCKSNINNPFATKNEISRLTNRFLFKFILSKEVKTLIASKTIFFFYSRFESTYDSLNPIANAGHNDDDNFV